MGPAGFFLLTVYIPVGILAVGCDPQKGGWFMQHEKNKAEKINNRENILNCAEHLFYQKGYDAVSVQEITDAAGITKPTLYYYFKSKAGLLAALLESKCRPLNSRLKEAADKPGDIHEILFQTALAYMEVASVDKEFYFFMLTLFFSARESESYRAVKPYMKEQFEAIKGIFTFAEPALGNMHGRQEQFAIGFSGVINHYILVYYEREEKGDGLLDKRAAYSLVHQFMHGIFS